jgi:NTE family protein
MNYAFLPLYAQANAVAGGNFDKLMVPFRCVASDVYRKEAVVFRHGNLGDAVRASMTFPFMFKPLNIDGRVLFDGGIFNNFPVDIMQMDFHPDFVVGSAVVDNPKKPDESDVVTQVQNLIMNQSNYHIDKDKGVLFNFNLENVNLFDFTRVDELVKLGYDSTMKHIDEIKARVKRTQTPTEVNDRRMQFANHFPELKFQNVIVTGCDSLQRRYVEQFFHYQNDVFTLGEFKEAYFKLIADDKILEVIPKAMYNPATASFDLHLQVKIQNQMKLLLGGNISSSTSNQAYFGINFQRIDEFAQSAHIDAQFGRMYNGLSFGSRIESPAIQNLYLKTQIVLHKYDYYEGEQLFYADNRLSNFNQIEIYGRLSAGFPIGRKSRLEFGLGYGALTDHYSQNTDTIAITDKKDKSSFAIGSLFSHVEGNTLDYIMYPTRGFAYSGTLQVLGGDQSFTSVRDPEENKAEHLKFWGQLRGRVDAVCQLTEIGEMQNATPAMQRIVMANPTIKQLYRRKAIEGWVDTYEDYNDNAIEHTDQTYRQVMSGIVREDGLAYTYHMTKDEQYEFDENDKADARITWAAFKAQIKRKGDDPTSTWNAALV